jgi:hypothetical protein
MNLTFTFNVTKIDNPSPIEILYCNETDQWKFFEPHKHKEYIDKCISDKNYCLLNIKNENDQKRRLAQLIFTGQWYI